MTRRLWIVWVALWLAGCSTRSAEDSLVELRNHWVKTLGSAVEIEPIATDAAHQRYFVVHPFRESPKFQIFVTQVQKLTLDEWRNQVTSGQRGIDEFLKPDKETPTSPEDLIATTKLITSLPEYSYREIGLKVEWEGPEYWYKEVDDDLKKTKQIHQKMVADLVAYPPISTVLPKKNGPH